LQGDYFHPLKKCMKELRKTFVRNQETIVDEYYILDIVITGNFLYIHVYEGQLTRSSVVLEIVLAAKSKSKCNQVSLEWKRFTVETSENQV